MLVQCDIAPHIFYRNIHFSMIALVICYILRLCIFIFSSIVTIEIIYYNCVFVIYSLNLKKNNR